MLVFENDGLMPLEAATTFGINVKLGKNPIGFFGTGLKYAIAICLRLGGSFRLFLGTTEYEFYVKHEDFRGKEFGMIRMRKRNSPLKHWSYQKLSFTTELGKHWEPWMAVRELESNTRDEGGESVILSDFSMGDHICGPEKTVIVVDCPEMEYAYEHETIFMSKDLKKIADHGHVEIFEGESSYIFYRGLRVTDTKTTMFTYNLTGGVSLTEDRTSKWSYSDQIFIMKALQSIKDEDILDRIMDAEDDKYYEVELPWDSDYGDQNTNYLAQLGHRYHSGGKLPRRMKSFYEDKIEEELQGEFIDIKLTEEMIERILQALRDTDQKDIDDSIFTQFEDR